MHGRRIVSEMTSKSGAFVGVYETVSSLYRYAVYYNGIRMRECRSRKEANDMYEELLAS